MHKAVKTRPVKNQAKTGKRKNRLTGNGTPEARPYAIFFLTAVHSYAEKRPDDLDEGKQKSVEFFQKILVFARFNAFGERFYQFFQIVVSVHNQSHYTPFYARRQRL